MIFSKKALSRTLLGAILTLGLASGVSAQEMKTIKVGVVGEFNAGWDTVNELLAKDHLQVKLVKYSDFVTPNRALNDGDIDLNSFQHKAYLAHEIERYGYKIEAIADTVVTPLRLYNNKSRIASLKDIKDGDVIGIPSDAINAGRALKLLEAAGLIQLDPSKGFVPSKFDITHYNVKIKLQEAEAGMLGRLLPDMSAAVITGGNALTAGLNPTTDAIFTESYDAKDNPHVAQLVNILVARSADAHREDLQKVVKAYQTPQTAQAILDAFKGVDLPAWKEAREYHLQY